MNLNLFDFTEDDLKSNRRGQITPRQREWLTGMGQGVVRLSRFNAWVAMGFVFFGSCLTLGLYMSNEDSRAAFFSNRINLLVYPFAVLLVIGIFALSNYFAGRLANRLSSPKLQVAEGKIRVEEANSENSGSHIIWSAWEGRGFPLRRMLMVFFRKA